MNQSSKDVKVTVSARTDAGLRRASNEDAFMIADLTTGALGLGPDMRTHRIGDRGSLLVVSDGMGGAAAGEIASEMAVKTIRESLMAQAPNENVMKRLRGAAAAANRRIWDYSQLNEKLKGMGATLTAVLIHQTVAFIAQVGDSRAYLVRHERIKQLTKDQSLAQALVDAGAVEPGQTGPIAQNVITQALGTAPEIDVEIVSVELCQGDVLVVCSDGLSNKVTDEELLAAVQGKADLTALCRDLVEAANRRGGEDNITLVVARLDGEMLHSAGESSTISGSFHLLRQAGVTQDYTTDSIREAVESGAVPQEDELEPTTLVFNPLQSPKKPPEQDPS
jgi:serine/threonine protein phosphatase PrpC